MGRTKRNWYGDGRDGSESIREWMGVKGAGTCGDGTDIPSPCGLLTKSFV